MLSRAVAAGIGARAAVLVADVVLLKPFIVLTLAVLGVVIATLTASRIVSFRQP